MWCKAGWGGGLAVVLAGCLMWGTGLCAQDKSSKADSKGAAASQGQNGQETDPLKRPLTPKQMKEREKAFNKEVGGSYKKWLDEDVRWIITDEERSAFKQLSNDEERDNFIEQFWLRRDPTPDTPENEFKEEHYRRIAYANEHFAAGIPGWKTDRGRMYIMYGKPDEIDSHPSGGFYQRKPEEGGGSTSTFPFETWRYRYLEGVGQEIEIEFVDKCMCNEYRMTIDRSEKDALLNVPGAGLTQWEEMGMANKADRFTVGGGLEHLGSGPFSDTARNQQFDRLEMYTKLNRPPSVKFKDLEEIVSHKIRVNLLPFDVRLDFVKVTSDTVLVPITLQVKNKDVTWSSKEGVQKMAVNIFGRVSTMTGKVVQTFEDTVTDGVPDELLPKVLENSHVYWKAVPLRTQNRMYRLDLVLKDVNGDRIGQWSRGIQVPTYEEDKLASSTLIIADQMEKVPSKSVGAGSFVIGDTKVRPRVDAGNGVPASFKRDQRVNFWMQVYNLGIDQQTHKPSAKISYEIVNTSNNKPLLEIAESTEKLANPGEQMTLEKSLPLVNVPPGTYRITIKVDDNISKQTITPSAKFTVE
ncbi:MAG: GWxTD domain-containing protein [Terriglobales bacterium]